MTDKPLPRPPQVTLCGVAVIVGAVFTLALAYQEVSTLGSIETQESIADFVSRQPGEGLGLSADQVQSLRQVMAVISGGAAVAIAVLGWYALQRQRSARLALSVLAPVALVAGAPSGDLVPAIVAVAVALLWVQPARDWFAGRAPAPAPARPPAPAAQPPSPPPNVPQPNAPQPVGRSRPSPADRPREVLTAGVLTIACSAMVTAFMLVSIVQVVLDPSAFESAISDQLAGQEMYEDVDTGVLTAVLVVLLVGIALWSVAAVFLAVHVLRGHDGARIALVVSAICAAVTSLVGVLVVVPLLVGAACVWVAVLLLRSDVARWFTGR